MSLTQDHGNHVFQCDGDSCHATLETATKDFDEAQDALRRKGWAKTQSPKRQWLHFCPDCQALGRGTTRQRRLV